MNTQKAKLTFCGGTGVVTGANFLFEIGNKKILVDCGLEQGSRESDASNREDFPYNPAEIDILIISHAHTDHIGRIGKLVKEGFNGVIYSTEATFDLAQVMLPDTQGLLENAAKMHGQLPLYEKKDVEKAISLWKTIDYYKHFDLGDGIDLYFKDAGHVLGSAMTELTINGKKIVFTGDLGNSPALFLRDTDKITDATYMVMESVYGDRNHESHDERKSKLTEIIQDTIARNRTLLIPAFSLERTQDILFEINDLIERKVIEPLNIYVDSPLATKVTEIYKRHKELFNELAKDLIAQGDDVFDFPQLTFPQNRDQSERVDRIQNPKIIIAGSGMSQGGRIISHEKHLLPDSHTTLLFIGYQSAGTMGRMLLDGAKVVTIDKEKVSVRAEVKSIDGYSSHKDSDHLIEFVDDSAQTLKQVFVAMGEPKSELFLVQRLRDYVGVNATAPQKGDTVELEF